MKKIHTDEDVYPAIEDLIDGLKSAGQSRLAGILHHRMHLVAWTTRSELFEELHNVLDEALRGADLPEPLNNQIREVVRYLKNFDL